MAVVRDAAIVATELLASPEGATASVVAGQRVPGSGYVVGQHGITTQATGEDLFAQVEAWVRSVTAEVAFHAGRFVGIWTDKGVTYLDVVRIYSEASPAFIDASKRGELAIYDLASGKTVFAADYIVA